MRSRGALSADTVRHIWFLQAASEDIVAAFEWYELQSPGLGAQFVEAVDDALAPLTDFPESCEVSYRRTRRCLVKRFPYEVFYGVEDGLIVVSLVCMPLVILERSESESAANKRVNHTREDRA
jgi:plasmid stabilization system protein ParE